jgi:hypothetical protein
MQQVAEFKEQLRQKNLRVKLGRTRHVNVVQVFSGLSMSLITNALVGTTPDALVFSLAQFSHEASHIQRRYQRSTPDQDTHGATIYVSLIVTTCCER